ncbi:hypothetical protein [Aeromonas cavernicola]|uniref:hypothetical protein n=1 Tax=Aeromonas cavernicola TaxID=1006623 RepID=UPI002351A081|nr:hypothetical protein [Aeromonas cavernicola]
MQTSLTVIGARPQFIKACVVSRAMAQHSGLTEIIVHTGQHFNAYISEIFLSNGASLSRMFSLIFMATTTVR